MYLVKVSFRVTVTVTVTVTIMTIDSVHFVD